MLIMLMFHDVSISVTKNLDATKKIHHLPCQQYIYIYAIYRYNIMYIIPVLDH